MSSQVDQALLQIHVEEGDQRIIPYENQNHMNFFDVLKFAMKIITSNIKFTFFMLLSLLPFYVFMVFYEIKIPNIIINISMFLIPPSYSNFFDYNGDVYSKDINDSMRNYLLILLKLFPLYLVLLPLLNFFSFFIIINIAQKIYVGELESIKTLLGKTIVDPFNKKNSLKNPLITTLLVQLLLLFTLVAIFWAVLIHFFIISIEIPIFQFSIVFFSMFFVIMLYKYLMWSALWNMDIVISILQGGIRIYAMEKSDYYYGKHCEHTCFKLMLVFFVYSCILRLPCLFDGVYDDARVSVGVSVIVSFFVCLGSLVKWVAFVVYYNDCKAIFLANKVDEGVGKSMKDDDDNLKESEKVSGSFETH